jgi:predicted AlkP superfamily pyrophosphatase or phosphodiesterase
VTVLDLPGLPGLPDLPDLSGDDATGSLADVMPSVAASLGVPGYVDRFGLAPAEKAVVLLVDGMGWELLRSNGDAAPFLSALAMEPESGRPITVGFPSTTATSMGSLGTGQPAGAHGLVGYTFALAEDEGRVVNALTWDTKADPLAVQPVGTVFQRAVADGVDVSHVALRKFDGSGLTRAALRGATYPGADTMGEAVEETAQALAAPGRSLVYVYNGDLDNVGHLQGCTSQGWRAQLAHVDLLARHLVHVLPPYVALHVTADHGMVDVAEDDRVDYDSEPELSAGVRALGGEPRARHVYAEPGAADDVLAAWRERLGSTMWVLSRAEAVAAGWFGESVAPRVLPRIGDVVAAPRAGAAVVARRTQPRESALVGYHGSLTTAERLVPFLVATA